MQLQHRWVHVVGALLGVALVVGLLLVVPRLGGDPDAPATAPATAPTSVPSLSPPPTLAPTAPAPTAPVVPGVPSITIPPLPTCVPVPSTPLRVVAFNIHGGRGGPVYDLDTIIEEVASWDADVVVMQEVHRFRRDSGFDDQPALLGQRLAMSYVFGRTYTRAPEGPGQPRRESGNLILSRLPIIDSGNRALPAYPGQEPRALLHVDVAVGDQTVRVYDTHLQHTAGDIRIVQSRAIRALVAADDLPFVLAGDLNATPESRPLIVLSKIATDPWPTIGTSAGLTVPARNPRRRIDYVLHGGASWVARQAQTVLSAISDHRAVVVDHELPPADPCGLGAS